MENTNFFNLNLININTEEIFNNNNFIDEEINLDEKIEINFKCKLSLNKVFEEVQQLSKTIQNTCILAENVSKKVRDLDLARVIFL